MSVSILRLYDGFADTSPQLRASVRQLQAALRRYDRAVVADGLFGRGTEHAVRTFQRARGLPTDGVAGPATWHALSGANSSTWADHFATSHPLDDPALLADLRGAARYGAVIERAATEAGLLPSVIAALGSRESGWGRALEPAGPAGTADLAPRHYLLPHRSRPLPEDGGGFKRGLLQIDYDGHEFARTGEWQDPAANLRYGAKLLASAKTLLRQKTVLHGQALLRGALAAYNCGSGNVLRAARQGVDLDFYTVGRDYSRDVVSRVGFFQAHGWD